VEDGGGATVFGGCSRRLGMTGGDCVLLSEGGGG
jgi:hypothetical protein